MSAADARPSLYTTSMICRSRRDSEDDGSVRVMIEKDKFLSHDQNILLAGRCQGILRNGWTVPGRRNTFPEMRITPMNAEKAPANCGEEVDRVGGTHPQFAGAFSA
jgi:hypothetical protein